ncbi:phage tail protein, partial [Yersinia pseudotuberculosis]
MQKIGDIPNTRADSNGEFTDGNVAAGVPPTILPAEWFNTIQRELMSILSAADIEADSEEFDQISRAILKLVSSGIDANKFLKTDNNLSEIAAAGPNAVLAAITNLNLLTTVNDANGALQVTRNLSDLNDTTLARTNIGAADANDVVSKKNGGTFDKSIDVKGVVTSREK